MTLADAEHFVRDPDWTWYILFYFFFAGLSGGSYFLASLMRLNGNKLDAPAVRIGYYVAFFMLLPCPVLLTLDLGKPLRFWHMLVNTTPGDVGVSFKYWSPMSVGAWALVVYGGFATVSFLEAWARGRGRSVRLMEGFLGKLWAIVGGLLALFIAGYTGVLLSVSNQPVWSDTWALGGLFLASGLSGSAALLAWLVHRRRDGQASAVALGRSERFFPLLELALIGIFVATLIPAGTLGQAFGFPWFLLWAVAFIGLLPGLAGMARPRVTTDSTGAAVATRSGMLVVAAFIVLIGVLALRAAVIFSVQ
ncbi:MAG TPA: NrfD/PsrC family molybdoenzyme membrane anchor subunit [Micromonosporaceae bacterium]|nr:NrfD/PsrC family molybdoenzyme membrane anchor subunit [Micromonosporaceae bacterium]